MKKCAKCKEIQHLDGFSKNKTKNDGRNDWCKTCCKAYATQYFNKNKEKLAIKGKILREKNKNQILFKKSRYREKNRELLNSKQGLYQKEHRKEANIRNLKYFKAHPGKVNAITAGRRAQKLKATPKWLTSQHKEEIKGFYVKAAQLTKETGIRHEVDHIFPLKAVNTFGHRVGSGLHVPWNLKILTKSENCSKSNILLPFGL